MQSGAGPQWSLVEYPVPAFVFLWIPWAIAHVTGAMPGPVYLLAALAADLVMHLALIRARRKDAVTDAEWIWITAGPALGAVAIAHFDLTVGVVVGLAVLATSSRPRLSAALVALATGLKYTPVIGLPAVLAGMRWDRRAVVTFLSAGIVLAGGSALIAGPGRLWSPVVWQAERGLQIESVAATPANVARLLTHDQYRIALSAHLSFDITGPGVPTAVRLSTMAVAVVLILSAALWWRSRRGATRDAMIWLVLAPTTAFIACNKVFSPQYLLWLTPVAAAGVAIASAKEASRLRRWSWSLLLCCALTQLGPVLGLGGIVQGSDAAEAGAVALLVIRNVGVVFLAVSALHRAWTLTSPRSVA